MTTDDARAQRLAGTRSPRRQRLPFLSGVACVPLFLIGWFASGGITPDFTDSDQDGIDWAADNRWNGRISGFAMLLAAFVFLHFVSAIRGRFAGVEGRVGTTAQLARVAFAGALTGVVGMAMALVTMAAASTEGAASDPVASRAVTAGGRQPVRLRLLPRSRRPRHLDGRIERLDISIGGQPGHR